MNKIIYYFLNSKFALAAYANLISGITGEALIAALEEPGRSDSLAEDLAVNWNIIDQYTDPNGFQLSCYSIKMVANTICLFVVVIKQR